MTKQVSTKPVEEKKQEEKKILPVKRRIKKRVFIVGRYGLVEEKL